VQYAVVQSLGGLINIKFWRLKWRTLQRYVAQFQYNGCFSAWRDGVGKWRSWSGGVQLLCLHGWLWAQIFGLNCK